MTLGSCSYHNAKLAIHENNRLTIGEQKNAIQNYYNLLLTEFPHMGHVSFTNIMALWIDGFTDR